MTFHLFCPDTIDGVFVSASVGMKTRPRCSRHSMVNRSVGEMDDGIITRAPSCLCCYCHASAAEESPWADGPDLNLNEVQPEPPLVREGLSSAEVLVDLCCDAMT